MIQDKAQFAVNGRPLTRAATQDWIICGPPFGRDEKPSSAALHLLKRTCHFLRDAPCS